MTVWQWLVFVGGVLHFGILFGAALVPLVVDFRGELNRVSRLLRQLVWVYAAFIVLTIVGFGTVSVLFTAALVEGTPLARAVCGFIGLFWLARLLVQFFVFDAKPYLRHWMLRVGYHGLTLVFVYHALVYGLVALAPAA